MSDKEIKMTTLARRLADGRLVEVLEPVPGNRGAIVVQGCAYPVGYSLGFVDDTVVRPVRETVAPLLDAAWRWTKGTNAFMGAERGWVYAHYHGDVRRERGIIARSKGGDPAAFYQEMVDAGMLKEDDAVPSVREMAEIYADGIMPRPFQRFAVTLPAEHPANRTPPPPQGVRGQVYA